jgi:hypothetical protein
MQPSVVTRWSCLPALALGAIACGGASQSAPPPDTAPASSVARSEPAPIGGCAAAGSGEELRTSDVDDDGRPEVCKYYRTIDDPERPGQQKSQLVRQDVDVNGDGKVDIKRLFDETGQATREEWDTDYDGRVDEVRLYEDGDIVRSERDQDNDGQMEVVRYYEEGKLERKETDTNGDGQTDRWEYFEGRVLDRVGVDEDHDGKVDSWAKAQS